jgi:acyl carrier protein phosphodiesterase
MNFLAHLWLSDDDAEARIGAMLPDLIRGRLREPMTRRIEQGVLLHRRVDAFTDTHPLVARSVARLRPVHGRFAAVLVDLWYDHLLARQWATHTAPAVPDFIEQVYASLREHGHLMPTEARAIVQRVIGDDWLTCYTTADGMAFVLERMSERLTARFGRTVDLRGGVDTLLQHDAALATDFEGFFPTLCRYAAAFDAASPRCTLSQAAAMH